MECNAMAVENHAHILFREASWAETGSNMTDVSMEPSRLQYAGLDTGLDAKPQNLVSADYERHFS